MATLPYAETKTPLKYIKQGIKRKLTSWTTRPCPAIRYSSSISGVTVPRSNITSQNLSCLNILVAFRLCNKAKVSCFHPPTENTTCEESSTRSTACTLVVFVSASGVLCDRPSSLWYYKVKGQVTRPRRLWIKIVFWVRVSLLLHYALSSLHMHSTTCRNVNRVTSEEPWNLTKTWSCLNCTEHHLVACNAKKSGSGDQTYRRTECERGTAGDETTWDRVYRIA